MTNKLYVTNISYNATASDLGKLFEQIGPVTNAAIAESEGKPLGFGFVVLADEAAARAAVDRLNNMPLLNRPIKVQLARPGSGERGREGGGGYRGRGGYDNRDGGGYRGRGGYNNREGGGYRGGGGYDNREGGGYRGGGGYDRDGGGYRGGGGYDRDGGGYRGRGGYDNRDGGGYRGRGGYDNRDGGGYRGRGGYSRGDYGGRGGWRGGRGGGRGGFRPRTVINEDTPRSETQIYVGNLAWITTVDELRDAFAEFGVKDVTIPNNKFGRALGFGLVDFNSNQGQQEALKRGKVTLHDREVVMSAAIIRQPRDEKDGDKDADQKN